MKKTMKKIACATLATISALGCAATMTACETAHPEVEMKITFQDKTYTLEYKLYRKVAPATVEHYMWLIDNDYFDGLAIHDFAEDERMVTGGYTVAADDATALTYKPYYDTVASYANLSSFPHSVWLDETREIPAYTLKGEFEENNFQVKNGAVKESFGALTAYYDTISNSTVSGTKVHIPRADEEGKYSKGEYQYNHTTSMFAISFASEEKTNNEYCTFATLDKDSVKVLQDLQEAIANYAEQNHADDSFTEEVSVKLFEDDKVYTNANVTATRAVPKAPIVITSMKVTKY